MSVILAEMEMVSAPSRSRGSPLPLLRGARRRKVKKAYDALQLLISQDNAEGRRAERLGYTPLYVTGDPGSDDTRAVLRVVQRLANVLNAKS